MRSKVKWFDDKAGYGFIDNGNDPDIFVHYSAIKKDGYKTLTKDEFVEFELACTAGGYKAKNVVSVKELV